MKNKFKKVLVKGVAVLLTLAVLPIPNGVFAMKGGKCLDPHAMNVVAKYFGSYEDNANLAKCCKEYEGVPGRFRLNTIPLNKEQFEKLSGQFEEYHIYGKAGEFRPKSFEGMPENIVKIVYEPGSFDIVFLRDVIKENGSPQCSVEQFDGHFDGYKFDSIEGGINYGFKLVLKIGERLIEFKVNLGGLMLDGRGTFVFTPNPRQFVFGDENKVDGFCRYNSIVKLLNNYLVEKLPEVSREDRKAFFSSVKEVKLPEGTKHIKGDFEGSKKLERVILPDGVKDICKGCFWNCGNLKDINIPENVKEIEASCFRNCGNLENIIIPNKVKYIHPKAFKNCTSLRSVNIPGSVEVINSSAFAGCTNLEEVTINRGVTSVGTLAFEGCKNLRNINIPEGVKWICDRAFLDCTGLTNVNIPSSTECIEVETFRGCTGLESINIPEGVRYIEGGAFEGCANLRSVSIPRGIRIINNDAFAGCDNLREITYRGKTYRSLEEFKGDVPEIFGSTHSFLKQIFREIYDWFMDIVKSIYASLDPRR